MKWPEIVSYLKFPFQCSCGEAVTSSPLAFSHYKAGHILHACPECGGRLYIPDVKGEYGSRDITKYSCYECGKEFEKDKVRKGAAKEAAGDGPNIKPQATIDMDAV